MTKGQIYGILLNIVSMCIVREGATEEDSGRFLARLSPNTREQKCLAACVSEAIGVVSISCEQKFNVRTMEMTASCRHISFAYAD